MTTMRDPERKIASYFPAISNLTRNFMIANYHAGCAFDHDDGSRFFHDTNNFEVYSSTKNYLGQGKVSSGNWKIYPEHYDTLDGDSMNCTTLDADVYSWIP